MDACLTVGIISQYTGRIKEHMIYGKMSCIVLFIDCSMCTCTELHGNIISNHHRNMLIITLIFHIDVLKRFNNMNKNPV